MNILGIESSCDETAAAVVADGKKLLSNVVESQIDIHAEYGGVVPEIASRSHVEAIVPVVTLALEKAFGGGSLRKNMAEIDAIAVTQGPGLSGSLLMGTLTARTLAWVFKKPIVGVNHVLAHLHANFLEIEPQFPLLGLIVSGGHSQIMLMHSYTETEMLGQTQDDAIGEAFDKVAKMLGLAYPGGPSVAAAAENGDPTSFKFPIARARKQPQAAGASGVQGKGEKHSEAYKSYSSGASQHMTQQSAASQTGGASSARAARLASSGLGPYDFSFSGIKTAVLRALQAEIGEDFSFPSHKLPERLERKTMEDVSASFQVTAVKTIVKALQRAEQNHQVSGLIVGGGVAANSLLRSELKSKLSIPVHFPAFNLCTDNAAMIATLGNSYANAIKVENLKQIKIEPSLSL